MKRLTRFLSQTPVIIILTVIALLWFMPILGLLVQSLRPAGDVASSGWWTALLQPTQLVLDNYTALIQNPAMVRSFWNTFYITLPSTILVTMLAALAAYAFAWLRFPGRDALFLVVVGLLVVPVQLALIPLARLFGDLGLFGTIPGVILFHTGFGLPFAIFLLRNFFIGVPRELLDSAKVDGANEFVTFTRIILPLARPRTGVTGDLPVHVGVERPAGRPDIRRPDGRAADRGDPAADAQLRPERGRDRPRRVPADARAAHRVLRLPALLRQRDHGRFGEG